MRKDIAGRIAARRIGQGDEHVWETERRTRDLVAQLSKDYGTASTHLEQVEDLRERVAKAQFLGQNNPELRRQLLKHLNDAIVSIGWGRHNAGLAEEEAKRFRTQLLALPEYQKKTR